MNLISPLHEMKLATEALRYGTHCEEIFLQFFSTGPCVYPRMEWTTPPFAFPAKTDSLSPTPKDERLSWPMHAPQRWVNSLPRTVTRRISVVSKLSRINGKVGVIGQPTPVARSAGARSRTATSRVLRSKLTRYTVRNVDVTGQYLLELGRYRLCRYRYSPKHFSRYRYRYSLLQHSLAYSHSKMLKKRLSFFAFYYGDQTTSSVSSTMSTLRHSQS